MYQLYYSPHACSLSVHAVLEEIGAPFEAIKIDFSKREQYSEAYKTINPKGKVPVLVHGDFVLSEAPAILNYLMELHPESELQVQNDTQQKYRINEWLHYLNGTVHQGFTRIFRTKRFSTDTENIEGIKEAAINDIKSHLVFLNSQLGKTTYISGENIRLPDFYLLVILNWWKGFEGNLTDYPNLERHRELMNSRPSVQRAMERERS